MTWAVGACFDPQRKIGRIWKLASSAIDATIVPGSTSLSVSCAFVR